MQAIVITRIYEVIYLDVSGLMSLYFIWMRFIDEME
jgi:hypothetical protein